MKIFNQMIEWIFTAALLLNALLFIPQAVRIFKTKSASSVSLLTFSGFLLIQLTTVLHGMIYKDYLLSLGYLLSILTCGMVVSLASYYKITNKKLSKEEINLIELFNQLPGQIVWKDKNGVWLGCNTENCKRFDWQSPEECKGKTDYDLFPKKQADKLWQIDQEIIKTGQPKILEESINIDHKPRTYLSHKVPLKNQNDEIIGVLSLSSDITETINTEKLELLENIIALLPGHVYWVDQQGFYLGCNDNQAQAAGLVSRKEIIGKKNSDLPWNCNTGVLPEALDKINQEVIQTGKALLLEEPATLRDGTELVFLSNKVPIYNQIGNIMGMVGISLDITDRKKIEAALRLEKIKAQTANKAKTEFLQNMRHDIRTALTGIVGLSELLQSETNPDKIQAFTRSLTQSSHELLRFLNEVLESIQVASGEIPVLNKKFSLREILENIVKLHQPVALKKQVNLTLKIEETLPHSLIGDPVRIYRVILELLANALKFTPTGHVNIVASLEKKEKQDLVIKILVEDTGIGIPLEKQQDLFVRFKRLTPSYEGIYQGPGLGLSIVKQFLQDLKGEIYLESRLNKGSQFACILPLKIPLLEQDIFVASNEKQPSKTVGLVVEDQPIAALIAKTLLTEQGYEMDIAENGQAAINQTEKRRYDFILMDIGLPDITGFELTQNIRSLEAHSQHKTFIIGLTAYLDSETKKLGLEAGMDIVLVKPLTPEMTIHLLKNLIPNAPGYYSLKDANDSQPTLV